DWKVRNHRAGTNARTICPDKSRAQRDGSGNGKRACTRRSAANGSYNSRALPGSGGSAGEKFAMDGNVNLHRACGAGNTVRIRNVHVGLDQRGRLDEATEARAYVPL